LKWSNELFSAKTTSKPRKRRLPLATPAGKKLPLDDATDDDDNLDGNSCFDILSANLPVAVFKNKRKRN
jgi:hypothetical protein